jgi:hypothetical protein
MSSIYTARPSSVLTYFPYVTSVADAQRIAHEPRPVDGVRPARQILQRRDDLVCAKPAGRAAEDNLAPNILQ